MTKRQDSEIQSDAGRIELALRHEAARFAPSAPAGARRRAVEAVAALPAPRARRWGLRAFALPLGLAACAAVAVLWIAPGHSAPLGNTDLSRAPKAPTIAHPDVQAAPLFAITDTSHLRTAQEWMSDPMINGVERYRAPIEWAQSTLTNLIPAIPEQPRKDKPRQPGASRNDPGRTAA